MPRVHSSALRKGSRSFVFVSVLALVLLTSCSSNKTSSSSGTAQPTTIFVQNFRYHGAPSTLSAGVHTFLFENKESFPITHEMIPVALPSGKTAQDITADAKTLGPDSESEWLHIGGDFGPADTGASVVETLYLPPGTYAFACWQTGTQTGGENGPPHAAKGMVVQFTVS
jgi:hypothetical protein